MKTKTLAELFGTNKNFHYDNALFEHYHTKYTTQDFSEEKTDYKRRSFELSS